jgi:hypothetical protein
LDPTVGGKQQPAAVVPEQPAADLQHQAQAHTADRQYGKLESSCKTQKVEAFADDTNIAGKATPVALQSIKTILADFAIISGLHCNVDKSMLLMIGTNGLVPDFVYESGFPVTDKLKILGFEINRHYTDLKSNFNSVEEKLLKTARFWDRFKLSFTGRINIAKCLMLSQISYYGAILTPDPEQIDRMQDIINTFVKSNMRVSKQLINVEISKGEWV